MKSIFSFSAATVFLIVAHSQCFALEFTEIVSKDRAKQLGLAIRSDAKDPDGVRVQLEFETKGELEKCSRVALEMHEGKKLMLSATLREQPANPGWVAVSFVADRTNLDKLTLKVVAENDDGRVFLVVPVKEFVNLGVADPMP